jgi:DNA polymerase-3 subunit beta
MRFSVERDVFGEAVAWAARILPARPAIPVLAGLVVEAESDGGLTFSGFDYEVSGQTTVEASVEEPGRVLVPGRLLADIARSLPARPVEVTSTGGETVVTCGSAEFGLLNMPLEDYPQLPRIPPTAGSVASDTFAAAVAQVVVAASKDDTLPMLTGVRLDLEGESMRLACTDRYRIAARELPWAPVKEGFQAAVVIPARTLADVARTLRSSTETQISLVGAGDNLVGLTNGGRETTARLLDDTFIDYRSRFTAEWDFSVELTVAPFVEAAKRVALVTERSTPLRLAFSADRVVIKAATGDAARATEVVDAALDGDDIDIAVNPHLLLDGLAGINGETVRLAGTGPTRPVIITESTDDQPDYRYLFMPLRLAT